MNERIVFLVVLVTTSGYALVRGGAPERWIAALFLAATVGSAFALRLSGIHFVKMEVPMFFVDTALAIALLAIALNADRFWPMWVAAIQLDAVATHIVMLSPAVLPWSYAQVVQDTSYLTQILLAVGTFRHQRRLAEAGGDPDWSRRPRIDNEP